MSRTLRCMAEAAWDRDPRRSVGRSIVYPLLSSRDLLVDERMAERNTEAERERLALRVALAERRRRRVTRRRVSPLLFLRRIARLMPTP